MSFEVRFILLMKCAQTSMLHMHAILKMANMVSPMLSFSAQRARKERIITATRMLLTVLFCLSVKFFIAYVGFVFTFGVCHSDGEHVAQLVSAFMRSGHGSVHVRHMQYARAIDTTIVAAARIWVSVGRFIIV